MSFSRLAQIVLAIAPEALVAGNAIELSIKGTPIIAIADPRANRMRAMMSIRSAKGLTAEDLAHLMQANFDTALDARNAIARGRLWDTFIHPLSPLERDRSISALIQTINLARTYGQTYSGGAEVFGGGDSNGIYQDLFEELQKKGQEL